MEHGAGSEIVQQRAELAEEWRTDQHQRPGVQLEAGANAQANAAAGAEQQAHGEDRIRPQGQTDAQGAAVGQDETGATAGNCRRVGAQTAPICGWLLTAENAFKCSLQRLGP